RGGSCLSVEGTATTIALNIHFEDDRVVDQPVDRRDHHGLVWKNLVPICKRLIGGDQHRTVLVAGTNQLEQYRRLGMVLVDVGEIVKHQQIVFVEFRDGGLELQALAGRLQPLHHIGGAGEQYAMAVLDEGASDRCR